MALTLTKEEFVKYVDRSLPMLDGHQLVVKHEKVIKFGRFILFFICICYILF